jgi:hypothetical protein
MRPLRLGAHVGRARACLRQGAALEEAGLGGALQLIVVGDADCLVVTDLRVLCRTSMQAGRVAVRILAAVSEWERTRTLERSRRGLAAARERGQPTIDPGLKRQIARMRGAAMTL